MTRTDLASTRWGSVVIVASAAVLSAMVGLGLVWPSVGARFGAGNGWRESSAPVALASILESLSAEVIMPRHRSPPDGDGGPNHWEIWLRDLDGYKVVLASPDGTAGGAWRPEYRQE